VVRAWAPIATATATIPAMMRTAPANPATRPEVYQRLGRRARPVCGRT
jgi:hypothetical protein